MKEKKSMTEKRASVQRGFDIAKALIVTLGGIATLLLILCPFDGPIGEIISLIAGGTLFLATCGIEKIVLGGMKLTDRNNTQPREDIINDMKDGSEKTKDFARQLGNVVKNVRDRKQSNYSQESYTNDNISKEGNQLVKKR